MREAAWNGFAPPSLPFVVWLVLVGIPPIAVTAYTLRSRRQSGPLGTLVLPLGCGLAIIVGVLMVLRYEPPCTASQFFEFFFTCEIGSGV
jgi:hypothetical protein